MEASAVRNGQITKQALVDGIMQYPKETLAWALLSLCGGDVRLIDLQLMTTEWWRQRRLLGNVYKRYGQLPISALNHKRTCYYQRRIADIQSRVDELEAKINAWMDDQKGAEACGN